jgi:hypothetical protein
MNTVLLSVLEQLAQETKTLLSVPQPDSSQWETYGQQRAAIFSRLYTLDVSEQDREDPAVAALMTEIHQQESVVLEKAEARLAQLRTELRTVKTSRQALRGYSPFPPAVLLECKA